MDKHVIIMRGWQGSVKSTLAKKVAALLEADIVSADDFYTKADGRYQWRPEDIGLAHNQCRSRFMYRLNNSRNVIVDNTNCRKEEYNYYKSMGEYYGYKVWQLSPTTPWMNSAEECATRNAHGVPLATIVRKMKEFEVDAELPVFDLAREG